MRKVKNLTALKKFSNLYKDYKLLDFSKDLNQNDYSHNVKLLLNSLKELAPIIEEIDPSTPTTQITFQVISEGYTTEKRWTEVQLNLKDWQKVAKETNLEPQLQSILRVLTGFNM